MMMRNLLFLSVSIFMGRKFVIQRSIEKIEHLEVLNVILPF